MGWKFGWISMKLTKSIFIESYAQNSNTIAYNSHSSQGEDEPFMRRVHNFFACTLLTDLLPSPSPGFCT